LRHIRHEVSVDFKQCFGNFLCPLGARTFLRQPNGLGFGVQYQVASQSDGELLSEYCPEIAGTPAKLTRGGTLSLLNSERSSRSKRFAVMLSPAKRFNLEEQMRVVSGTFPDRRKVYSHEIREPPGKLIGEVLGKEIELEIHERSAR
jgi:hypothetical protein